MLQRSYARSAIAVASNCPAPPRCVQICRSWYSSTSMAGICPPSEKPRGAAAGQGCDACVSDAGSCTRIRARSRHCSSRLEPGNVLITQQGRIKLAGFGIGAKFTAHRAGIHTKTYVASATRLRGAMTPMHADPLRRPKTQRRVPPRCASGLHAISRASPRGRNRARACASLFARRSRILCEKHLPSNGLAAFQPQGAPCAIHRETSTKQAAHMGFR